MEKKKVSKKQMQSVAKYESENYFKTLIRFYKSDEQAIRAEAERQGLSLNAFIVKCVLDSLNDKHIERN